MESTFDFAQLEKKKASMPTKNPNGRDRRWEF
jgi:hypothetical protein